MITGYRFLVKPKFRFNLIEKSQSVILFTFIDGSMEDCTLPRLLTGLKHSFAITLLLGFVFMTQTAVAVAADPVAGKAKAATCAVCHGAEGVSSNPQWPNLAGQQEAYLLEQLLAFQKGAKGPRNSSTMTSIVATMTPADLADIAAYYASLPIPHSGTTRQSLYDQGKMLYRYGDASRGIPACMACHGPDGRGNSPGKIPEVAGQNDQYIMKELQLYANGGRSTDPNQIMHDIAKRMNDKDMAAVASYMAGLQVQQPTSQVLPQH